MSTFHSYFQQQGRMSDPGEFGYLFQDLLGSIADLVRVVQGVTIHIFWAERYGFQPPKERMGELELRSMPKRLERTLELEPSPMQEPRPPDKKLLGNCRDHSLLLASMLRHQKIPARARCGFGAYFLPDHYEDHWVTEYWNAEQERWILVDAQLDDFQCQAMSVPFDPLDVPRDQFVTGGTAWRMCRSGGADPEKFGIFDMHGLGFIRGNLVRDIASLNKMEMLPWDCWGIILSEQLDDPDDLAMLDEMAALTEGDVPEWETVQSRYQSDPRLRIEGTIQSYVDGQAMAIAIN
jgi:hypothetical protein